MRALAIVIGLLGALTAPAAAQTDPDAGVDPVEDSAGEPSGEADLGTTEPGPSSTVTGGSTTSGTSATGTSATGTSATGTSATGTSATGTSATGTSATGTSATAGASVTTSSSGGASGGSSYEHAAGTGTMSASRAAPSPYYRDRDDDDDDDEEDEDGGDPYDFLWIELIGGYSYVDLRAIRVENFYPEAVVLRGDGPMGGGAVGFRIEFLSVGVRAAVAHYGDDFDVGTATAEITLAIPIPIVKPFLRAGFGLGWHGDSDFMAPDMSQTTVFGWAFTGAVGADIYFAHWFAVGVAGTIDILNMNRQSFDEPIETVDDPLMVRFEDSGDAVGIQARGHIAVSFHL